MELDAIRVRGTLEGGGQRRRRRKDGKKRRFRAALEEKLDEKLPEGESPPAGPGKGKGPVPGAAAEDRPPAERLDIVA